MIYYRGDKFVKGKKFKIDESVYTFIKKSRDNKLVFESVDNKSLLQLTEEEFNEKSRYELVQADSDALDEFYEDNSLTFEGASASKENLDFLYNWLKDLGAIGDSTLSIYTYKGNMMNEKYGLTGYNAYPDDLTFLTVRLDDMQDVSAVVIPRFQIGGRWFNDIVDNNRRHEGTVKESVNTSLSNTDILEEKVNKDNAEINELIGKALRSKSEARKIEDRLAQYGITVDYDKGQGVYLTGPNGKTLSASVDKVTGPTKPGFNDTHKQSRLYYSSDYEETKDKLDNLKNMSDEDKLRKFRVDPRTGKRYTDKEALERYNKAIQSTEETLRTLRKYRDEENRDIKAKRRVGHNTQVNSYSNGADETDREHANKHIDYLTYLTKEPNEYQDAVRKSRYYGASKPDATQSQKDISKYNKLKNDVSNSQWEVDYKSKKADDKYRAMSDDELEAKIKEMRDNLEKQIEELRKGNVENNDELKYRKDNLNKAEKELDDFLKSKGVRESKNRAISGKVLDEKASEEYNRAYYSSKIDELYDEVLTLAREAQADGYTDLSKDLDYILGILDRVSI